MSMVIASDKVSDSIDMIAVVVNTPVVSSDEPIINVRTCAECRTIKTPLWRSGPTGPKSLCNACGIRCVKKKNELLGIKKRSIKKKAADPADPAKAAAPAKGKGKENASVSGELSLGSDEAKKEENVKKTPAAKKKKTGEVEHAALILMSLSRRHY